jgi:KDO2-lipid IV(A) lauroyltransferase
LTSFKKAGLSTTLGIGTNIFRFLPFRVSLWVGRCLGWAGYYLLPKKRAVVYANLKTAFSTEKSPHQLQVLTRSVFINFVQSFIELLCFFKIKRLGFKHFVQLQGRENVDQAVRQGKGVILLAIHSGNWELGSVLNSTMGYPYSLVANEQPRMPKLAVLLNECRCMAGAHIIAPGAATKEIIKALHRNEIVTLVLDQGGQEGVPVKFLGKTAAMSTGAIRLALKYGCALCPAWIIRKSDGYHVLEFFPAMKLISTGDLEKDITANVQQAASYFEHLLHEHPEEYLWFYKVFKYTTDAQVVILDDGGVGHLQQSQATAQALITVLKENGKNVKENIITLDFRTPAHAFLSRFHPFLRSENYLKYFLTDFCYQSLMNLKADFVISCGSQVEGVNFILSKDHQATSMVLTPV